VRHGLDPSEQGGTISIGAHTSDETLRIWVSDNGVGLSEHTQPGTGINNLRERLSSFYKPAGQLQLQQNEPHGLHAELVIPHPSGAGPTS
jgi:LytS/YehU family sensor histidine kinase